MRTKTIHVVIFLIIIALNVSCLNDDYEAFLKDQFDIDLDDSAYSVIINSCDKISASPMKTQVLYQTLIGLSGADLNMVRFLGAPVQIIYNSSVYSVDGSYNYNLGRYNYENLGGWD